MLCSHSRKILSPHPRFFWSKLAAVFKGGPQEGSPVVASDVPLALGTNRKNPAIRHVLGVASLKGGVGKSTITANLAVALNKLGLSVGIWDADGHRPSLPYVMNLEGVKINSTYSEETNTEFYVPITQYDVKCMSLGFLPRAKEDISCDVAVRATLELFQDESVKWGEPNLDVLIVDFPAGAGDIPIELMAKVLFSGVIVVTTPQPVAVGTALKTIKMFKTAEIPIYGVVENMAAHKCSSCGQKHSVFGHGGGELMGKEFDVDFLGSLPLDANVKNPGKPLLISHPNSPHAQAYRKLAQTLKQKIDETEEPVEDWKKRASKF